MKQNFFATTVKPMKTEGTNIRWAITVMAANGLRVLAFDGNYLNTYATEVEGVQHLRDVLNNNTPELVQSFVDRRVKVEPIECWSHGDPKGTVFGFDKEWLLENALTSLKELHDILRWLAKDCQTDFEIPFELLKLHDGADAMGRARDILIANDKFD